MGFFGKLLTTPGLDSAQPPGGEPNKAGAYLLMQQQASVDMLRALVRTGRAEASELENAERRLKELEGLAPTAPQPECRTTPVGELVEMKVVRTAPIIVAAKAKPELPDRSAPNDNADTMLLSAELMSQIDKLTRRRAEACNAMHDVPKDQDCPELMAAAMAIHNELEDVWTKYRYLERNGKLPEQETEKAKEVSLELLKAIDERKRYAEKRSKLKKKLADPYNHKNKKRDTWTEELEYADLEIRRLDDEIYLLKNR